MTAVISSRAECPKEGWQIISVGYKSPDDPTCSWPGKIQFGRMRQDSQLNNEGDRIYIGHDFQRIRSMEIRCRNP